MSTKYYNLPLIKDLEFAADFIVHYFKFQEYIEIQEQYLGRKPEEVKSLLVECGPIIKGDTWIKHLNYKTTK
jgi:hypothetical protein